MFLPNSGRVHHPFVDTKNVVDNLSIWAADCDNSLPTGVIDIVGKNPKMFNEIFERYSAVKTRIYSLPQKIITRAGSDAYPLFGISRWHLGALLYNIKNFEHTNDYFKTEDIDQVWTRVAKKWLEGSPNRAI